MSNFFSSFYGGEIPIHPKGKQAECHAKDPSNCRWHETGKFSPSRKRLDKAAKEDNLTPAERELQKIKARQAADNAKYASNGHYWGLAKGGSYRRPVPSRYSYASTPAHLSGGFNDFIERQKAVAKPKLRTVEELREEIAKIDPETLQKVVALGEYTDHEGKTHKTRVSPLTGKPISEMCDTIINALMCGVKVKDSEIEAMPEWKDAQRRYADYSASLSAKKQSVNTWSDLSKEREAIRKEVYAKMSAPVVTYETNDALKPGETYEVEKGFRFDIITGLPAGGKNAAFADRLSVEHRARLADSDIVKRMLPGYADGLGANIVHDESTYLNKDLLDDTFRKSDPKYGDNIVYPTLGNVTGRLFDFIERAHDAGYKVHIHFNDISPEKAKGRMIYRMINTGRYLPLRVFGDANAARSAYSAVKDYADTAEMYESGAGKGVEPRKVEEVVNVKPKVRPKPKPASDYGKYGLFGYYGGASGASARGGGKQSAAGEEDGYFEPSWLDSGSGDDDVPEWLANDSSFWGENLGLAPSKSDGKGGADGGGKPQRKSGLSIDDILANFEKRKSGGAA